MNTKNTESEETTPGDSSPPGRVEKPNSGSSRHSGFPLHWDFESCNTTDPLNHEEKIRPSSWDDSDDDWSPKHESNPKPGRIYSSDDQRFRGSVTSEINELKKQFIEFMEKIKDNKEGLEILRDEIETSNIDRRQSPARIRRRTKSSSSSSPVPESKNQHFRETTEETSEPETACDETSSRTPGLDPKFYLNNFFTELRSKRISLNDSLPVVDKSEKEEPYYDGERIQMQDELNTPDAKEVDEPFCRTSRKLSQILEVEESKKDLEKSSEESMQNTDLFLKSLKNPAKHDFSPLQTARSRRSEKILENVGDIAKGNQEKYKSMSSENFWNFQKVRNPFRESLSARTGRVSDHKISDDFISLSAKTGKTRLVSPKWMDTKNHKPFQFASPKATVNSFSQDPDSEFKEKGTVFDSLERLNLDLIQNLTPENQPSRRSTDRSEQSGSVRADSGRNSKNSESPKFTINIGRDSDRSLKLEDLCTPDSLKRSREFKARAESKTEGNLALPIDSPSLESVKSTSRRSRVQNFPTNFSNRSGSSHRSQRKKERQRKNNLNTEPSERKPNFTFPIDKAETYYSNENIQGCIKPNSISYRSGYSTGSSYKKTQKQYEHQSEKSARTINSRSSISLNSDDTKSITAEDRLTENQIFDRETPRENGTPDLDLPTKISERTTSQKALHRKENAMESDSGSKKSDRSETNMLKHRSRGSSKGGSSSRSGTTGSRKSSLNDLKTPPNTNSASSNKSKDSLENHDDYESAKVFTPTWKELEKNCDALSNHTSASSDSKRSSWRELETSYQQYPFQKEIFSPEKGASGVTITPKYNEIQEERPSRSQESSGKFADSFVSESLDVNNSTTPVSSTSRPTSQTSEKYKETDIHLDFEKLDLGALSERTTNRSITFEKDEDTRERQSTQRSKSEAESDKYSIKKLSVISEASYENTETSNFSIENEDKDTWEQSRPNSKKGGEKFSHRSVRKTPKDTPDASNRNSEEKFLEESMSQPNNSDGGKWNELIETFCTSPNSSSILENTFPTFPYEKKNLWNSVSEEVNIAEENEENENLQNSDMFSTKLVENKYGSSENNIFLEKELEADFRSRNLGEEDPLLEKISEQKDAAGVKKFQNLYYFNVERERSFGIGEFGDVTSWNSGKFDTVDFEKPKDHGDGIQTQKVPEVLALPEKREKEVKTQRQLWTEFREDSRDLTALISKQYSDVENDRDFTQFIRVNLKTSKSDNCLTRKNTEENECPYFANCEFLHETNITPNKFQEFESNIERDKETSKSTIEKHSSVEKLEFEKEDSENSEFDCERTPRLSRSMSSLPRLQKENFEKEESDHIFQTSRTQLFEKSNDNNQTEKDFTNLNIFLAQKEKMTVKSNNWLSLKNPEKKKSRKQMQKTKTKRKPTASLQKPFNEYLYSRESHSSVPHLKLRNSNCFQNFYKRFINVFCLTSTSSAATSK